MYFIDSYFLECSWGNQRDCWKSYLSNNENCILTYNILWQVYDGALSFFPFTFFKNGNMMWLSFGYRITYIKLCKMWWETPCCVCFIIESLKIVFIWTTMPINCFGFRLVEFSVGSSPNCICCLVGLVSHLNKIGATVNRENSNCILLIKEINTIAFFCYSFWNVNATNHKRVCYNHNENFRL